MQCIQRASEEENEEKSIIAGIALDVLVDPESSLTSGRRERVGVTEADKSQGPAWSLAGDVLGGELGEWVYG